MKSLTFFEINDKVGISPFQNMICYLGGSTIQTIGDNPVTSYRQLIQQYAKNNSGTIISPKEATIKTNKVFLKYPVSSSLSGLYPRLVGILFKRIPKFGFFLGYDFFTGGKGEPGFLAATTASIFSAPFINPIRMIEKQQRISLNNTGIEKPISDIIRESSKDNFKPLFRGTIPLIGHSLASALLGLVGQPKLQKSIKNYLGEKSSFSSSSANLISSAIVSPIYVIITNPLSRLEVIMQTHSINKKSININQAIIEITKDIRAFGVSGLIRGQNIGIAKAIISLSLFHEGRMFLTNIAKRQNKKD